MPRHRAVTSKGAVEIVSIRTITLDDMVVVSRGKEVRISAESSLAGNRLTLRRFEARSGNDNTRRGR